MKRSLGRLLHHGGDTDGEVLHRWRLEFLEPDLERGFRTAERERNLRQARFGIMLALLINLGFGLFDPLIISQNLGWVMVLRLAVLTPFLGLLIGLTYTEFFRTRWPALLIWTEWGFAIVYGIINVIGQPPEAVLAGFVLVVLGAYLLLPLIFQYGAFAAWLTSTVYFAIIAVFADASGQGLFILGAQLVTANIIGMLALYRSERFRRLDHLNSLRVAEERARYHELLTRILPHPVAHRLERGETVTDEVGDASVLFADIVGFTALASQSSAPEVVGFLNQVFSGYDELVARHGLEKIKTIGDCYMVAGGVPGTADEHLSAMARLALDMQALAADLRRPDGEPVAVRIGLHAGDVLAGVIGESRFLYDLWGDTVNVASRMERNGEPRRIQVSDAVYQRLKNEFAFAPRGDIEVKGKGRMPTWYLTGPATAMQAAASD